MTKTVRVFFAVYEGFEPLDLTGPASVFQSANFQTERPLYEIVPISQRGGAVTSAIGFSINSRSSSDFEFTDRDFFLICGGEGPPLFAAADDTKFVSWLVEVGAKCGRVGSVCSGAYLLAKTGLADGRTISSHWDACKYISKSFPKLRVNNASIYTKDGDIWTSAGATTGIDMALAIVEEEHGPVLSAKIAKRLVVFARRQGNQRQFSSFLEAQTRAASREIRTAVDWMIENTSEDISVQSLASIVGMTERTFYRKFEAAMGISPAKFLERLRLDVAKDLLEDGIVTKEVAGRVGFRTYSGFRIAFQRAYGLSPSAHQRLHSKSCAPA